jgi:hypothetical protein
LIVQFWEVDKNISKVRRKSCAVNCSFFALQRNTHGILKANNNHQIVSKTAHFPPLVIPEKNSKFMISDTTSSTNSNVSNKIKLLLRFVFELFYINDKRGCLKVKENQFWAIQFRNF